SKVGQDRGWQDLRPASRRGHSHPDRRTRGRCALTNRPGTRHLFVLVGLIYLLSFPYHPRLRSPNELSRLMQTRALVDFGELNLDRAMGIYGPVGDLSFFRGHYYPSKAPFLSFAAVPIYWTLRVVTGSGIGRVPEIPLVFTARLFLTVLPTLIILILI